MFWPVFDGLNVTEQLADAPVPESVQPAEEKRPGPLLENVTGPPGVIAVPGLVSVMVTVQTTGLKLLNRGEHARPPVTPRFSAVTLNDALLALWSWSPW